MLYIIIYRMKIALDFDGVLFNDRAFKAAYWRIFKREGVSLAEWRATYQEARDQADGVYDPDRQIKILRQRGIKENMIRQGIAELLKTSAGYLYRDADGFLQSFQKKQLSLVSAGSPWFQKEKIATSGISRFFTVCIATPRASKVAVLRTLLKDRGSVPAFLIDDKKEVIDEIARQLPEIMPIQLIRHQDQPQSQAAYGVVRNLAEVRRLIMKYSAL